MNDFDKIVLSAEERETFETFYRRRLAEAGGAASDEEELAILRDILQAVAVDGLTPTADGGASYVRRGALDWSDPNTVKAAQATAQDRFRGRAGGDGGGARDIVVGVVMLLAVAVGGWWYFGPRGKPADAEVAAVTPPVSTTVGSEVTPTPLPTLEAELLADIVGASGVKTGLVVPRTLEVGGVSFVVQPVAIQHGDWPLPDDERAVSWVYGTVVNYVLGVEATSENKTLLAGLKSGDELLLRMSTGPTYRFAFAGAVRVAPQASEIFRQTRPGLTLVLMGEAGQPTRVVIQAAYLPQSEAELDAAQPETAQPIGQAVNLNGVLKVTALGMKPVFHPHAPPGYAAIAVSYQLENVGPHPLHPATFGHGLEADGLTYAALPDPVTTGPPDRLLPGQTTTLTSTYALPERISRQGSVWTLAPDPVASVEARVALPGYSGPLAATASIDGATISESTLALTVTVTAPLADLTVQAADIALVEAALDPVASQLPWQLQAGESKRFQLALHPSENVVQVTLFDQPYNIELVRNE